jgi:predicted dehydrogenase
MTQRKDPMNRRAFLQNSAVAGLVGYSAVQSASFASPTEYPGGRRYRIGVIGSTDRGDYGHELDTAWFAFPNCEIVAVADDNEKGRAEAVKRLGLEKSFSDYREMLDKAKPDIACICPRWVDQHRDMAVAAAERGIHVYMEKPFVPTLEQADEVVAACDANGVKFALALWTHYSPKLLRVKQLIADGAIGRVLEYRCRGKEDHRGGAEDLWVLGIHVLDMILFLGGHPDWCYAHMSQNGEPVAQRHVVQGDEGIGPLAGDVVHAMWGMPDSSTAYFGSHREAQDDASRNALQIFGSRGIIEIREGTMPTVKYLADPSWCPGRSGAQWQDVSSAGIGLPEPLSGPEYEARHALGIRDLLGAIENDRPPLCNAHESRAVTEMILSVFESHRQRKPVTLPLETRVHPFTMPFSAYP